MKKISILLLTSCLSIGLSACGTMNTLHNKLADLQLQKKQLANGKIVYMNFNVNPSNAWGCKAVGHGQTYNWAELQMQGQFTLAGAHGLLMQKALDYANQNQLNTNYINMTIPDENTLSLGSSRMTNYYNLHPKALAVVEFFQCKKINPEHQLGVEKSSNVGLTVGG